MAPFAGELLSWERQRIDLRAGVVGLIVLSILGVAIVVWGPVALAAAIGALLLLAADPPHSGRSWAVEIAPLAVGGTILTFVAVQVGDSAPLAATLVGLVAFTATVLAGQSDKAGVRAMIGTIWIILALGLGDAHASATSYALAFAGGAVVGAGATWLKSRSAVAEPDGATALRGPSGPDTGGPDERTAVPLRQYALLRAIGLAVATFLGFQYFPDHPAWVAITVVIVVRPPTRHAYVIGLQRSLGTGLGVILAVLVADIIGENEPALIVLFLASAFLAIAFREVNYALFASFVTALVVYSQRILGEDASESGQQRLVETVLGVAIAFTVLAFMHVLERRQPSEG